MKRVGVAQLKARLSEYLRGVRRGEPLTVMDRKTPVAVLAPYDRGPGALVTHLPPPDAPKLHEVDLPAPLSPSADIVELLLVERQVER
jgi:prevent-host-death family protein